MIRQITRVLPVLFVLSVMAKDYEADWKSLDARPVPQWWRDAKFGIFIHWGPYAVPAYAPTDEKEVSHCYAEWYHGRLVLGKDDESFVRKFKEHHGRFYGNQPYGNFAAQFSARFFKPKVWADLFRKAGAKYVILTAKHHDGYALWPSAQTPYYNSVALGSGRDLCQELGEAVRGAGMKMGYYYSLMEYANPRFMDPKNYRTEDWVREVNIPQLKELANKYLADVIWADGANWRTDKEWHSEEFLAWLYNESNVKDSVVVNDRWGRGCSGKHGGHYCTEYGRLEENEEKQSTMRHPWEECRGIGRSFGYNRFEGALEYLSAAEVIRMLVRTVSAGGNFLLDIGPDADGLIPAIMEERLLQIGAWLDKHSEAIYGTEPGPVRNGDKVVSTQNQNSIYLFALDEFIDCIGVEVGGRKQVVTFKRTAEPVRVVRLGRHEN